MAPAATPRLSDRGIGVVLMEMGGPATVAEIEPFLRQLLADPLVVALPAGRLYQSLFARIVARRRARRVAARYEAIGGGSPLPAESERLAARLAAVVEAPVVVAMRYGRPDSVAALARLAAQGITRLVALPLFPQYCTATTASSLAALRAASGGRFEIATVAEHHLLPEYVAAMVAAVRLALLGGAEGGKWAVLATAHSIPVSYTTRRSDPYVAQVEATAGALAGRLGPAVEVALGWQSAGPVGRWQGPTAAERLAELAAAGVTGVVVQPLSFVSENLETLHDLDIVLKGQAEGLGLRGFCRLPTPGGDEGYIDGLARLAREAAAGLPEGGRHG